MSNKKVTGDPSPKSVLSVDKSSKYERMRDFVGGNWYPSAAEVVYKHKESGTFWRAVYRIYEDFSEADQSQNWTQVTPKTKTIVEYEVVK